MTTTKFGLAQPVRRVEDPRLLKGAGRYTDDIVLPGMLLGVVLRSPHAAAKITGLDTAAAKALPGVRGVYTAADLAADGIGPLPCAALVEQPDGSPQAARRIRCWPTARCAMSAIRSRSSSPTPSKQARDAAEVIQVDYDMLPSATDLATAMDAGRAAGLAGGEEQPRVRLGDRRQGRDRCRVRRGRACDEADRREQPDRRDLDGGARRHRRLRSATTAAGRCTPTPRAAGW